MAIDPRLCRPGHARARTLAVPSAMPRSAWHLLLAALLLLAAATGLQGQVAINATGAPPGTSNAMLDISSVNKGLLIPRMTASQRAIIVGPDGLIIYQTDSSGSGPAGYWYYDAAALVKWRHIGWNNPGIWQLGGNAGTTSADFIGTTNLAPMIFRIVNYDRGRLNEFGQLQFYSKYPNWPVGAPSPITEQVHVQGGVKLSGGSAGDNEGNIRFVPASGGVRARFEGNVANTLPAAQAALLPTVNGWKQLDNNFYERKLQETPKTGAGCQDPSQTTLAAASVDAGPRPWPKTGPVSGPYVTMGGQFNPYYGLWEDGHRQYLFQATDLAAMGLCPGPSNPIRAIAFNVTGVSSSNTGRIHFLRFRMKNTIAADVSAGFDNTGLIDFANPAPPDLTVPKPAYSNHGIGYDVQTGWNVHGADVVGNFFWAGSNLLLDAALDDQEWSTGDGDAYTIKYGTGVDGYSTSYPSTIAMYCDACGGTGSTSSCPWKNPPAPGFYFPPTTPINGDPGLPGSTQKGWGWTGGWFLTAGVNTSACDGATAWGGGGPPSILQQLPRVAFLAKYTGGGAAYDVGSYMVAQDGLMVGDAAWAASGSYPANLFRGPGTISAKRSVWSGSSLLSDHVFDLYYTGTTRPEDAKAAGQYVRVPLQELPNYVERERRLPNVQGRSAWNREGGFSVDQLTNQLWVAVEDQALYIQELNQRMDALRQYLVEKKLKELEGK